jgi:hypothetical protein
MVFERLTRAFRVVLAPMSLAAAILVADRAPAQPAANALNRFAGNWELRDRSIEGKTWHDSLISEYCRWSDQHAFMICEERSHGGPIADVTLMWRDGHHSIYRFADTGTDGSSDGGTITISAQRWVWTTVNGRHRDVTVNDWVTRDLVRYRSRSSDDGGKTWQLTGEGTEARVSG